HGVPRQIHMDERAAVSLKINALTGRFGRDEESNLAAVEPAGGTPPVLPHGVSLPASVPHAFDESIAVDERDAVIAIPSLESAHQECLSCLVLCEEEHRPTHERLVYDLEDPLDLGLTN